MLSKSQSFKDSKKSQGVPKFDYSTIKRGSLEGSAEDLPEDAKFVQQPACDYSLNSFERELCNSTVQPKKPI